MLSTSSSSTTRGPRAYWNFMELYETLWNFMELYGTLWNFMELYGNY